MKPFVKLCKKTSFEFLVFFFLLQAVPVNAKSPYVLHDDSAIALRNITLVDGSGVPAQEGRTLLLEDGKIVAVQGVDAAVPEKYLSIDLTGHTVLPGLVMLHEHMFYPTGLGNYTEMVYSFPRLYLAGGATSIRTAGTLAPYADLNMNRKIAAGELLGPDIDVTAPYLNGPGLPILKIKALDDRKDAARMVKYWKAEGVTSYKMYMHIRQDEMRTINQLAHKYDQKTTGHLCSVSFREAADLGIDNLEHGFLVATDFVTDKEKDKCPPGKAVHESLLALEDNDPRMHALIDHLIAKGVAITSTLTIYETFAGGRPLAYQQALDLMNTDVKQQYLDRWSKIQASGSDTWSRLLQFEMKWEKRFVDKGGKLIVGTDPTGYGGVIAGWSNLRALELLVEAGFVFEQAVYLASLSGAEFLGKEDSIGSVVAGKRANLAIFAGAPHSNVADVRKIKWAVKDGVVYDSMAIFAAMKGKVGLH